MPRLVLPQHLRDTPQARRVAMEEWMTAMVNLANPSYASLRWWHKPDQHIEFYDERIRWDWLGLTRH